MVPIFFVGLLLGYLRTASGSLVPAALLHVGFNAVPFLGLFGGPEEPTGAATGEEVEPVLLVGTLAASLVCLCLVRVVSTRSRRARQARQKD